MSTHIGAQPGQIAQTVLLPGDPLRARYIADNFLTNVTCYNTVRNMLGFTGFYKGKAVSVQGSGMGMPSLGTYVRELAKDYGVKRIIRVGSCGAFQPDIKLRGLILAQASCSDSAMNTRRFKGLHYAPIANFVLLLKAFEVAHNLSIPVRVGNVLAPAMFYDVGEPVFWKHWGKNAGFAAEMESPDRYPLAALHKFDALSILTVSDSLATGEHLPAEERERSFADMVRIALEL